MTLFLEEAIEQEQLKQLDQAHLRSVIRGWMLRHYRQYPAVDGDGLIDVESMSEQAALEWCADRKLTDALAAQVAGEVDQ